MLLHRLVVLKLGYHCKGGKNVYIVNTENVQTTGHQSDNLQYNTLGRWDKRLIEQVSDVPSIFFIISHRLRSLKTGPFKALYFYIAKNFARYYEKRNTWNIRQLVDESFVPATQRIILKIVGFYATHLLQLFFWFRLGRTSLISAAICQCCYKKG